MAWPLSRGPDSARNRDPGVFRHHLLAAVLYAATAIVFTFPLAAHLTTAFPNGHVDVYQFLWNNWWTRYALTTLHANPFWTDFVLAPFGVDLRLHNLGALYAVLVMPLYGWLGQVGVLNVQILATVVANGFAAYRLVTYVARDWRAGLFAGFLIAATPAIEFHLPVGRPACAGLWPAIFALYWLLRLLERPSLGPALWLAASIVASMLTDQIATLLCGLWMAILMAHALVVRPKETARGPVTAMLAVVMALILAPAYALYWRPLVGLEDYGIPPAREASFYSYPVQLLWTPSMMWRVYGTVMPIALIAVVARLARRSPGEGARRQLAAALPWVTGAIGFVVLSFGPVVMRTTIPMPFGLLQRLPLFEHFRTPYRFQIAAAIGLAVSAGLLIGLLHGARKRWLVAALWSIAVVDLFAYRAVFGFPLTTLAREAIYEEIAADPRDVLVLEVPIGVRTTQLIGPGQQLVAYQAVHHKRLLSAALSRGPQAALDYYRSSPALMFLANLPAPPGDLDEDLLRQLRVLRAGYIVVHPELMDAAWVERVNTLIGRVPGAVRIPTTSSLVAYRLSPELIAAPSPR